MIHAQNFKTRVDGANLTVLVDPSLEALDAAKRELEIERVYTDYAQALACPNIDAVVIVSPTKYHREIAVAAASAGKHILCEKPMAMTEEECDDMLSAAAKNHVKLQVGFMRRFDESYIEAKKILDSGEIGDLVLIKSHTRGPSIPKPWMYDISKSNGPLAEVNSHDIDTLRWFAGSEIESLYAIAGNYRCPDAKAEFPDFYDNVLVSLRFFNGVQGEIDGAQGVQYGYDAHTEILGTRGVIHIGRSQDQFITTCNLNGKQSTPYMTSWRKLFKDAYLEEDVDFIHSIKEDREPRVTGLDGKMAVRIVNAGNQSLRENCIVYPNR